MSRDLIELRRIAEAAKDWPEQPRNNPLIAYLDAISPTETLALLDALSASEARNRALEEALKEIAEHPGPDADDAAWTRVEWAREALGTQTPQAHHE